VDYGKLLDALRLGGLDSLMTAYDAARAAVDDDRLDDTKRRHRAAQRDQVVVRNRSRIVACDHAL
jgi:hypothetical protein